LFLLPQLANRHGLIAGATGTGKTVSLQVMAENFSRIGVPVFMADVKATFRASASPARRNPKSSSASPNWPHRLCLASCPVTFWDVFGEQGHPVRATISEMGPLLLARMLNLNDTRPAC